jgi:hypothetical protein
VLCFYVLNAELALMFIPVPIKAKNILYLALVAVDLYLGVSGQSLFEGPVLFCSRWRCIIWLLISIVRRKINLKTIVGPNCKE